ncbi:ubiquitin-conjugating enzyme E2 [Kitasatospora sp. NPDC058032]|uniref:ubiquitin-conjugating enzyme E2 n=1 Tax=unclassified Kitasatospora TaxID=2633591 RepID=UPI0033ACD63F
MVMSPRDRRLQSEFEEMKSLAASSSMLSFTSTGVPPTQYSVTLTCRGLMRWNDRVGETDRHEFDITLGAGFPKFPPTVVWRTPIFHPNFKPPHICTGDIWYPGISVAEFCVEICNLIQYKSFNIYDPLDVEASLWLVVRLDEENPGIPVDTRPLRDLDFEITARASAGPDAAGDRDDD